MSPLAFIVINKKVGMLSFTLKTNSWGAYLIKANLPTLETRFSKHPSVSTWYRVWLACPSPRGTCLYNPDILVAFSFWTFGFLTAAPCSPLLFLFSLFPSPSYTWPSLVWLLPIWTLPDIPAFDYALPHIYNKLSLLPCLGTVMSFPSFYIFSFIHWT